jgi:ABC-2 type transport system ATP-binding protein
MTLSLEATDLGKRYGGAWALRHCSLRIPAGRIAALVGPNGAGKTTLLHLAAGLLTPTEGDVRVLGWSPRAEAELVLARIGFVAQDTPLYRRYSVGDTLRLGRALNRRWDDAGALTRLRRLGIPLDVRVGRLSGGQRAQVALALVLAKRPELLLLDEPLASLDPLARRQFLQELMEAVVADGLTLFLSSHLVGELERACDQLVLLDQGRVRLDGDIEGLLATHRLLVGPRESEPVLPERLEVVGRSDSDRETSLWVRGDVPSLPAAWRVSSLSLEDLVLAYLSNPRAEPALDLAMEAVGA